MIELTGFARIKKKISNREIDPNWPVKLKALAVSPRGRPNHPLTLRMQQLLAGAATDDAGILMSRRGHLNHLLVSPSLLPRALRILDALFGSLEQSPFKVVWPERSDARLEILVDGQRYTFSLREIITSRRIPNRKPLAAREGRPAQAHVRDYCLTGRLRLVVMDFSAPRVQRQWTDHKHLRIEAFVDDVLEKLVLAAMARKKTRQEGSTWRQRWEEQDRRNQVEFQKHQESERKMGLMRQLAGRWASEVVVLDTLTQLRRSVGKMRTHQDRRRGGKILGWARQQLDQNDLAQSVIKLFEGFDIR